MRLPSIRQLQYFLSVAEHLSFSRAAEDCHITQSALSNALNEMESILGQKLFSRDTRTVTLTPTGRDLVEPARGVLAQIEHLVHLTSQHRAPLSSRLTMGIIPTIAPYMLPYLLPRLHDEFPDLDLHPKEDITERQLDYLAKGVVDVVLMAFPYNTPSSFKTHFLWSEYFYLADPETFDPSILKTMKTKKSPLVTLDDLEKRNILLLDDGHCLRDHIVSACHLSAKNSDRSLGATSLQTLLQMVAHGFGSTLLPEMATTPNFIPKGVVLRNFAAHDHPHRDIGLLWRKNDPREDEFKLLGRILKGDDLTAM